MWVPKISHTRACPQSVACKSGLNLNCFNSSTLVRPTLLCLSEHCERVTDRSRACMHCMSHHCSILQVPGLGRALPAAKSKLTSLQIYRPLVVRGPSLLQTRLTRREGSGSERSALSCQTCSLVRAPNDDKPSQGFEFIEQVACLHHFTRILSALQASCCRMLLCSTH